MVLWESHQAGSLPYLPLDAGPHLNCLVSKALLLSSLGQCENPNVFSKLAPLAAIPPPVESYLATTARQHPSQHGHWPSMPVGGDIIAAPGPGLPLSHQLPSDPQDIGWGPPVLSHRPERFPVWVGKEGQHQRTEPQQLFPSDPHVRGRTVFS